MIQSNTMSFGCKYIQQKINFPPCKQVRTCLTIDTQTANFIHGIIKLLVGQQIFLQSMDSMLFDKYGIFAQLG